MRNPLSHFAVLVCGGRDYTDFRSLCIVLDKIHARKGIHTIIEGGARGADALARKWAVIRAIDDVRPGEMAPDLVVACPGWKEEPELVARAKSAGVKVYEITD